MLELYGIHVVMSWKIGGLWETKNISTPSMR